MSEPYDDRYDRWLEDQQRDQYEQAMKEQAEADAAPMTDRLRPDELIGVPDKIKLLVAIGDYSDNQVKILIDYIAGLNSRLPAERECAEKAERELAEAKERERWIPVNEGLPEDRKAVLVWCPDRKNKFCVTHSESGWRVFGAHGNHLLDEEVTHWRPLPAPPKEN